MGKNRQKPSSSANNNMVRNSTREADAPELVEKYDGPQGLTLLQKIVFTIMLPVSLACCYLALHRIVTKDYHPYLLSENSLPEQVFPQLIKLMCLLLVVQVGMSEWMELISEKTNNDFYRCHRNIIRNHIEWFIIFGGILAYDLDGLYNSNMLVPIVDLFCVGRVLFAFGYMVGVLFELQSIRAPAVGLTISAVAALASLLFKFRFLSYFL